MRGFKKVTKVCKILLLVLFMIVCFDVNAKAADFNGSVSSATVSQGESVSVTVTFSSDTAIGAYAMRLTYDAGVLDYISGADGGGGGTLQFYNDYVNSTSKSYTLTFTAKAAGTSTMSLETISVPCDTEANDMTVKTSQGVVTVQAPVSYSSDNNLSALNVALVYTDGRTESVALNPQFTADVTTYSLSVSADVSRLSIDAAAADVKASLAVSGTRMDEGSNSTTITVTAEDGSTKKYVIYTEKAKAEVQETTTEPESETETETQEETTAEEVTQPSSGQNNTEVEIGGLRYLVTDVPEGTVLEGYEVIQSEFRGVPVRVLQGLATNLKLMYLVEQEGGQGDLFIYDKDSDSFIPYVSLTVRQHIYAILTLPEDGELPFGGRIGEDFTKISIVIGEQSVQALSFGVENLYFVYAMNWNGERQFYYYDAKEVTMLRYENSNFTQNEEKEQLNNSALGDEERQAFEKRINKRNLLIIVLAGLIFVFALLLIIISVIIKRHDADDEEDENLQEESEDEWPEEESVKEQSGTAEAGKEELDDEDSAPLEEDAFEQAIDDILRKK